MTAIWTWRRPWQALSFASGVDGWTSEWDYPISAPESLQRVIFRCELAGCYYAYVASTQSFPLAGLIIARIIVADESSAESAALITRGIAVVTGNDLIPNGTSMNVWVQGTISPIELDFEYRKIAPPPPANPLMLTVQLTYEPFNSSTFENYLPLDVWRGNFDLQYLTSQPGVTTPP